MEGFISSDTKRFGLHPISDRGSTGWLEAGVGVIALHLKRSFAWSLGPGMVKGEDTGSMRHVGKFTAVTQQVMMRDQTKVEKEEHVGTVNSKGS